jgi:mutator protein MutT
VRQHDVVTGALVGGGRVLLVHRSPHRRAFPDVWDLPGGHVEAGESALAALARELREELGVRVVADSAHHLGELRTSAGEEEARVSVWLVREWHGVPANVAPEEHDRIGWFSAEDVRGLPTAHGRLPGLLEGLPGMA